jgi:parallel beta-helix repeat protein
MNMKKLSTVAVIILLFSLSAIPSNGFIVEKKPFIVFNSRSYIQDLINNASDGDTIYIPSGIYYENIIINKSISLVGEDKNNTIIDGGGSGVIIINFDEVTVSDFTIQNSGNDSWNEAGIKIYSNHTIIIDNIISNNGDGIHLDSSISNIITDNIILNNRNSIYLEDSSNTNINGNNALNNLYGIYLESSSNNNIINGNNALNNFCGISISSSSNNIIMGNNVSNNTYGISLFASSNNIIMGNNASNNFGGISFSSSKNNNITGNNASNNTYGISLDQSSNNNIIIGNNASNNHNGISLSDYSNSNIIIGNNISWNLLGIYLYISCSIIINNNLICNNIQSRFENIPGYYFLSTWWDGNYWNKSRTLPKPIFGTLTIALIFYRNIVIPWIAFDWHPAKEPYDIGV